MRSNEPRKCLVVVAEMPWVDGGFGRLLIPVHLPQ